MAKQTKKNNPAPAIKQPAKQATAQSTVAPEVLRNRWVAAGLAAFALALYANTFGHDLVLDDPLVISLNKFVQQGFGGLFDIFTHSYRAGSSVSTDSEYMYRPLSVAAFAFEEAVAPKANGFHHFMNVLWYALTAGLMYFTIGKLFPARAGLFALAVTALFVAHPIHTEVVANIKSRDEIMSFFFSLLCLNWYWDATFGDKPTKRWFALGAFFLALLAKEGAVTLLAIVPLCLYYAKDDQTISKSIRQSVWLMIPFVIWFVIRFLVMNGRMSYTPDFNDNQLVAAGFGERLATGFVVLGKYLQLLVWPAALSWDYSYNQIQTVGWGDWKAIASAVFHVGLVGLSVWGIRKRHFLALAVPAYLISMVLYSNLVLMIGTILGERLVYGASLWFSVAVVWILWRVLNMQDQTNSKQAFIPTKGGAAFLGIIGILVLAMSYRTIHRNADWKSNATLFIADQFSAPGSFRTLRAAGEQYLLQYAGNVNSPDSSKLLNQAADLFTRSKDIRPTENAYIGLGNVSYIRKDYPRATDFFKEALKLRPNNQLAKERITACFRDWGKYEGQVKNNLSGAVENLNHALEYIPDDAPTLRLLGTAYGLQNKHNEAVSCYEKALLKSPNDKELLRNLSVAYRLMGDIAKADNYAKQAGM